MFDHFNQIRYIIRETIERIDAKKSRDRGEKVIDKLPILQVECVKGASLSEMRDFLPPA